MSVRASASAPSSCSGDMYWNVPRIVPATVRFAGVVGSSVAPPVGDPVACFARPKSSSFAPAFVRKMFAGFKSR